jgi:hypothetical protein
LIILHGGGATNLFRMQYVSLKIFTVAIGLTPAANPAWAIATAATVAAIFRAAKNRC